MRKIILPIIVLMLANIGFAVENKTSIPFKNGANDVSDSAENIEKIIMETDEKLKKLNMYNSDDVISNFSNSIHMENDRETINRILKEAEDLTEYKKKIFNEYIDKAKELCGKLKDKEKIEAEQKICEIKKSIKSAQTKDAVNKEIPKLKSKLRAYGYKSDDIEKYTSYLDAFYYKNNNIFDSYNDDIFFDLKLGGDVSNNSFLSSLTLGGAYKLKKPNVKLGGFVQYDYQTSHNISLGTSVVYDNFLGFVRYRLAMYNKVVNHNVDVFGKYYYEFKFNKLKVAPTVSLYSTVSSRVNVNNVVSISPRIGFDLNLGTKLSYNLLKNLNMFTEPTITVSYNDQNLDGETKNRSYFGYDINFGVEYKKSGISVKPILRLTGDMLGNVSLNTNIGIGYKF